MVISFTVVYMFYFYTPGSGYVDTHNQDPHPWIRICRYSQPGSSSLDQDMYLLTTRVLIPGSGYVDTHNQDPHPWIRICRYSQPGSTSLVYNMQLDSRVWKVWNRGSSQR
jgi:hypothetical protein